MVLCCNVYLMSPRTYTIVKKNFRDGLGFGMFRGHLPSRGKK